ncbi:MAG: class IV adenylate cyclase [Planctomycetales bacterium]|nr:class IV adenylate cyclase [Planctomycetales bacterium]MBN8626633.1 class IV adenylate cyclase [Planctomycetota bacterium]
MKLEVEQKFRIDDPAALRQRLSDCGVKFAAAVRQSDAYFNHPARDFARTDEALRIRSIGDENFVTYKGPKLDRTVKTRHELEQPIAPGRAAAEKFTELLVALGFRPSAVVDKSRSAALFKFGGVDFELAWDEVDGIGTFLEIELVVDAEARDTAKSRILALQQELGLTTVERRSYLEMVLEST